MKRWAHVVIVGFPNVGKSTLFNRLLRRKKSLVHVLPGMTRDAVTSVCTLQGKKFLLTDTGGIFDADREPLADQVRQKAWEFAQKADILLFVLDGRRGLLPAEEEMHLSLKRLGKPILVIVNKVDVESLEAGLGDFYRLGVDIFPVSAEHKKNFAALEESLAEALSEAPAAADEAEALKIAVIGRINVGKSSLVNRLCGEERLIVSAIPGTTRDSTDTLILRNKKPYCLVDTAGIRRLSRANDEREKASIIIGKKNIVRADVLCQVLDVMEFPTHQDLAVAQLARGSGKPLVLALNKWDLIKDADLAARMFEDRIRKRMEFVSYAPVIYVSALTGKGIVKILDMADKVHANSMKTVGTPRLNDFLGALMQTHYPQTRGGRPVKIRYMTQKGVRPPSFILFAGSRATLTQAYEKFFVSRLREEFDFWGTPLRLSLREG